MTQQNITYTHCAEALGLYIHHHEACHQHPNEQHLKQHSRFTNSSSSNPLRRSSTKDYSKVGKKFNNH